MSYEKQEVDELVANLNGRIDRNNTTLSSINTAVIEHNSSPDAHKPIFDTKALKTTVSGLSDTVEELIARIESLDLSNTGLKGTLIYYLTGNANETVINIMFDIQPIDENNPVTYEVYGDGTLISGLTFDASTGTITGTPTFGGTATYVVLAKSGRYGAFITINQNFEGNENTLHSGYEELSAIVRKLRSGDINDLVLGTQYTVAIADDTPDKDRMLQYDNLPYKRWPSDDTDNLYAWANADSRIYTDAIAIFAGAVVRDSTGTAIGTLSSNPTYMKDYKIMLTSIDTDDPTAGTYVHNARFEFLNILSVTNYLTWSGDDEFPNSGVYHDSARRAYLTSEKADGFLVRIPSDIKGLVVSNNIECITSYTGSKASNTKEILSDKFFLSSAYEFSYATSASSPVDFAQEGTRSGYYNGGPSSPAYDSTKFIRYTLDGYPANHCTRTMVYESGTAVSKKIVYVRGDNGTFSPTGVSSVANNLAPAFVIA